ncbi:PX [Mycoreovirus 3]|uniref:PX n=1 Tax=Rosellinia necatrix mycoreovirus 3 (isolate W370) TaxID=311229 RepID=Q8JXF5_MYRVW|nr:PX [Mycoreovirus 3]BAC07518.1 PX [Mycoreovirus 3]
MATLAPRSRRPIRTDGLTIRALTSDVQTAFTTRSRHSGMLDHIQNSVVGLNPRHCMVDADEYVNYLISDLATVSEDADGLFDVIGGVIKGIGGITGIIDIGKEVVGFVRKGVDIIHSHVGNGKKFIGADFDKIVEAVRKVDSIVSEFSSSFKPGSVPTAPMQTEFYDGTDPLTVLANGILSKVQKFGDSAYLAPAVPESVPVNVGVLLAMVEQVTLAVLQTLSVSLPAQADVYGSTIQTQNGHALPPTQHWIQAWNNASDSMRLRMVDHVNLEGHNVGLVVDEGQSRGSKKNMIPIPTLLNDSVSTVSVRGVTHRRMRELAARIMKCRMTYPLNAVITPFSAWTTLAFPWLPQHVTTGGPHQGHSALLAPATEYGNGFTMLGMSCTGLLNKAGISVGTAGNVIMVDSVRLLKDSGIPTSSQDQVEILYIPRYCVRIKTDAEHDRAEEDFTAGVYGVRRINGTNETVFYRLPVLGSIVTPSAVGTEGEITMFVGDAKTEVGQFLRDGAVFSTGGQGCTAAVCVVAASRANVVSVTMACVSDEIRWNILGIRGGVFPSDLSIFDCWAKDPSTVPFVHPQGVSGLWSTYVTGALQVLNPSVFHDVRFHLSYPLITATLFEFLKKHSCRQAPPMTSPLIEKHDHVAPFLLQCLSKTSQWMSLSDENPLLSIVDTTMIASLGRNDLERARYLGLRVFNIFVQLCDVSPVEIEFTPPYENIKRLMDVHEVD